MTSDALEVVEDPERAQALLHPARQRILASLGSPDSAAGLARRLDLPRQRLNYHVRELEAAGLVERVEERRRGNVTERTYRRSAGAYAISSAALGALGAAPEELGDRFSSAYLIALAARAVREVGELRAGARRAGKRLPTLSIDAEVRFASPAARHAFAEELAGSVAALVAKHHDPSAAQGRSFRVQVGAYPRPREDATGGTSGRPGS